MSWFRFILVSFVCAAAGFAGGAIAGKLASSVPKSQCGCMLFCSSLGAEYGGMSGKDCSCVYSSPEGTAQTPWRF